MATKSKNTESEMPDVTNADIMTSLDQISLLVKKSQEEPAPEGEGEEMDKDARIAELEAEVAELQAKIADLEGAAEAIVEITEETTEVASKLGLIGVNDKHSLKELRSMIKGYNSAIESGKSDAPSIVLPAGKTSIPKKEEKHKTIQEIHEERKALKSNKKGSG